MKSSRCSLFALSLMLMSSSALSCTITITKPTKLLKVSSAALLAFPTSVSTEPANALNSHFKGEFKQTVEWQVLVSWKGKYQSGDKLTTSGSYVADQSSCGTGALYRYETTLIFLEKRHPLENPGMFPPQAMIEHLKYLERIK